MSLFPDAPDETFKQFVYDRFSQVGKAFASPHRLVVLNILCQGEHTVESLARHAGLSIANVSRHLQLLRGAGLLEFRKVGTRHLYAVRPDGFEPIAEFLETFWPQRMQALKAAAEKHGKKRR